MCTDVLKPQKKNAKKVFSKLDYSLTRVSRVQSFKKDETANLEFSNVEAKINGGR